LICVVKVKAGDDGKMFGSVTAGMIADELKHQFDITLDKRKIHLESAIKTLGEREVELHLHAEVKSTLKVRVESLTPVIAPVVETAPAEARTEKRGKRPERVEKTESAEDKPKAAKEEKPAKATKAAKVEKKARSE
jgi:Ribosomal protein L9, C-terminal domain